jgi:hypothetical protein
MISSLEIFDYPNSQAFEIYTTLAKKGSYNPYIQTVKSLGLSSPFISNFNFTSLINDFNTILD